MLLGRTIMSKLSILIATLPLSLSTKDLKSLRLSLTEDKLLLGNDSEMLTALPETETDNPESENISLILFSIEPDISLILEAMPNSIDLSSAAFELFSMIALITSKREDTKTIVMLNITPFPILKTSQFQNCYP